MASKGGARAGAGNPGYGKMEFIRTNVEKFSPKFWTLMEEWSKSKDFEKQKVFITEFNKIQTKMIPTTLQGDDDGGPVQVKLIHYGDNATVQLSATALPNTTSTSN